MLLNAENRGRLAFTVRGSVFVGFKTGVNPAISKISLAKWYHEQ